MDVKWFRARRFRVTSSNIHKLTLPSVCPKSVLDPEPFFNEFDACSSIEKTLFCYFGRIIFNTGIWVHQKYHWVASSPDGFIELGTELFPLEIKAIIAKKTSREVMLEYYHQFQLHMEVTNSVKIVLLLFNRNNSNVSWYKIEKDEVYLKSLISYAEKIYFENIPYLICKEVSKVSIEEFIKTENYIRKYYKMQLTNKTNSMIKAKPLKKNLIFEELKIDVEPILKKEKETIYDYWNRAKRKGKEIFEKKYGDIFSEIKEEEIKINEEVMIETLKGMREKNQADKKE